MKVVIVGGGAGGMSTASNIRRLDKDAEITVITRDENVAYSPCAIPYVLSGKISSFDDIIMKTPDDYKEVNIDVLIKSAPAYIAISLALRTLSYVPNSPVSRITFSLALPLASLIAAISSNTKSVSVFCVGAKASVEY